jgi:DNA-binding protein HU-beta
MNKKELIEAIAERANTPKSSEAQRYFDAFEEVATKMLKSGDEVQITGFGKLYVREQKAREGRNPQTGEKMRIAARRFPPLAWATPSRNLSRDSKLSITLV